MEIHHSEYNTFEDLLVLEEKYSWLKFTEKENWDIMLNYNYPFWKWFWVMLPLNRMVKEVDGIVIKILENK